MDNIITSFFLIIFVAGLALHFIFRRKQNSVHRQALQTKELAIKAIDDQLKESTNLVNQKTDEIIALKNIIHQLEKEKNELSKYQDIIDAKVKARSILEKVTALIQKSENRAGQIIQDAKNRAQNIAGEAFTLKDKTNELKQFISALNNKIEGYGDSYIIPSREIIDDLAEQYDHKDAGVKLKEARTRTKELIKLGLAARCDYAENKRRTTAVNFVVYAFNGLADAILTRVKHDNFGKLKQEIVDGFILVNHNGQAFRNAQITEQYLAARQDELRWAVAVYELRLQEREEQRQIKEAIREEERARREYEKAIKEAEKEEKMLQKAMDQARRELSTASEQQRLELEQQLAELQQKYDEAERKNQKAISMAQQTKRGHVYVISNIGSFGEDIYKIGLTRRLEPMERVKELGDASVPFQFDVHAMIYHEDAPSLEKELHRAFQEKQVNKANPRKEFFRVKLNQIKSVAAGMGIDVHWTMLAEAREYRESSAEIQNIDLADDQLQNHSMVAEKA